VAKWDSDAIRAYWQEAELHWYRYFVHVEGEDEKEVGVMEWRNYERQAGFIPAFRDTNATGGFVGYAGEGRKKLRISGRMMWNGPVSE
jgi:hypothetical protein